MSMDEAAPAAQVRRDVETALGGGHRLVLKSSALGRLKLTKLFVVIVFAARIGEFAAAEIEPAGLLQDLRNRPCA